MTEVFTAILKASFQGSIVILAVVVLRLLLKKAPKSLFCLLWLLAGLRLALSFEIQSPFSLQPRFEETSIGIQAQEPVRLPENVVQHQEGQPLETPAEPVTSPELPAGNGAHVQTDNFLYEVENGSLKLISYADIAAQVWLLGAVVMLFASLVSYWKLKRRVREAYLIENGCFECPGLDTAFVLGFFPPRIYLPMGLSDREKQFVYEHENTHIARNDHWFKILGYVILSIHWFNPLVWLGYSLLCRDMELACDEHVVKYMTLPQRKAYSAALLSCGGRTARFAACPVAFGESNPKKRILNVLNYKRPSFWIVLLTVIAVIFVAVCLLTSPGNSGLLEFGDAADAQIDEISIHSEKGLTCISDPDDIRELVKILRSISWEADAPTEKPSEFGSYGILFDSLLAEDALYFSEDCSLVWAEGTQAYSVTDAGKLLKYLDSITDAVWCRETSGDAFATVDQPVQWLKGISENAVREAELYVELPTVVEGNSSSTTRTQGILTASDFDALLDILNELQESSIVSEGTLRRQSFDTLRGSLVPHGGMTLTVYDDVNQLVMVLRLVKNDVMEFILIDELDKVQDGVSDLDHPRCWILEDDRLLAFLKEMQEHPTVLIPVSSFQHDEPEPEKLRSIWDESMTDEEYLALCRDALAEIQSREQFHISETLAYFRGETEDSRSNVTFWRDGENRLRQSYVTRLRENHNHLYYEGCLYFQVQGESGDPSWTRREITGGTEYGLPWLCLLNWDNQPVVFEGTAQEGEELKVSVTVHATPPTVGWDEIQEYNILFFFNKNGNLTRAIMSAVLDSITVIDDLKIETTLGSNIHSKIEEFAAQRPDAPQVNTENEAWLEKCRSALEAYQALGSWAIQVDNSFSGKGAMNKSSIVQWYGCGDDIYEWHEVPSDGGAMMLRLLQVNGEGFHREAYYATEDTVSWDKGWEPGDYNGQSNSLPWPVWYDWDAGNIEFAEVDGKLVSFIVQGSPFPGEEGIREYRVTFELWDGVLHSMKIEYSETDSQGYTTDVRKHYDLYLFAPGEAEKVIQQRYSEALLHIHGICNDPACTDSTHDHSGVNCTDDNCTNATHHQDEHHNDDHHH